MSETSDLRYRCRQKGHTANYSSILFGKNPKNKVWRNNNNTGNNQNHIPRYWPHNESYQNCYGQNRNGNGYNDRKNHYSAHSASDSNHCDWCNPSIW